MTRRHSTVFDALANIRDRLVAADWPTHGDTLARPDVGYAFDESPDVADETVQVIYKIDDDATIEWVTIPGTRDEKYLVEVVVQTAVPGQTQDAAWLRLEELAEVVQGVFYNPTTGEYTSPVGDPGTPGYYPLGGILRVAPTSWHDAEGWVGQCVVTVAVAARI